MTCSLQGFKIRIYLRTHCALFHSYCQLSLKEKLIVLLMINMLSQQWVLKTQEYYWQKKICQFGSTLSQTIRLEDKAT